MNRNKILLKLGVKSLRSRTFRNSDAFMDEFIDTLTNLGGVYAKFLQGVLLGMIVRSDKQNKEDQLAVFEDNPDPMLSHAAVIAAMGAASNRVKIVSTKPLGVGSYSAVYDAVLDDQYPVVVKILRPDVKTEIGKDLRFLRQLSWLYNFAAPSKLPLDIGDMYGAFKKTCIKETDFSSEIAFANELYGRYKNHPHIVIPKTYQELCSEFVIVQDKIVGISAKNLIAKRFSGEKDLSKVVFDETGTDLLHVLRVLSYDALLSLCTSRPFHGDIHPGNVRILPNNKIALIDFGIRAEPFSVSFMPALINKLESDTEISKGNFDIVRILDAHTRYYMSSLYNSLESFHYHSKNDFKDFFTHIIKLLNISVDKFSDEQKREWQRRGSPVFILQELIGDLKKFGFSARVKEQSPQRALSTLWNLNEAFDLRPQINPVVYQKVAEYIKTNHPELAQNERRIMPDLALENVYLWLEKISNSNPELAYNIRSFMIPKNNADKLNNKST